MAGKFDTQSFEDRLLGFCLLAAVAWSVICNIVDIDQRWQAPLIFLGLYAILRTVVNAKNDDQVLTFSQYRNNTEFYSSVQKMLMSAQSQVSVTYFRTTPPPGFHSAEADSYFRYILDWARTNPNRELRRIIGVPATGPVRDWVFTHHQETKDIENYTVKVLPWTTPTDGINLAIIDDTSAHIALTIEGQQMRGLRLDNPEAARYLTEYYTVLWSRAEALATYLARTQPATPDPEPHQG